MTHNKLPVLFCFLSFLFCQLSLKPAHAAVSMQDLADSLTAYTGFSPVWSPPVRVKQLRVNGNRVTVRTNPTLSGVRWTDQSVRDLNRRVSRWVLGNEKGKVTIYSNRHTLEELITDCARGKSSQHRSPDLTDRHIALWPSHGLYYNRNRGEWIWQRATLWTTVEDLYSQEYVRLLRRMLENAGAMVSMPRAGIEESSPGVSGMPQWTEGARYWLQANEADSALWDLYDGDEYKDDMKCRPLWVNGLANPVDLCLALHTDGVDSGDDSTIIGTLAIYTARDDEGKLRLRDGRDRETVNRNLADWIQTQITSDLRHWDRAWTRRQLKEANYCESRVPVVPSVLIELLSHKNMADMRYGLNPAFRFAAARSLYKGILRFLNGPGAVVQPLPVEQVAFSADGTIRWQAVRDSLEPSATPTYYLVYVQENEGEWDVMQSNRTSLRLTMKPGVQYNAYIVAANEGGLAFPSPTVSAYQNAPSPTSGQPSPTALIIDAFHDTYGPEWFSDSTYAGIVPGSYACEDRFSCAYIGEQWDFRRSSMWLNDDNCGWGACYRDHAGELTIGNTRDYAAMHGHTLRRMRISYSSCTGGMIPDSIPSGSDTPVIIDVVCGRNRMPIDSTSQHAIGRLADQGGRLLISGENWHAVAPEWLATTLHARFYAPAATRSGRIAGTRQRITLIHMQPNPDGLFSPSPEALMPVGENAFAVSSYEDMRCPAAIGYRSEEKRTLIWGFPLEACMDFDKAYRHAIRWLLNE